MDKNLKILQILRLVAVAASVITPALSTSSRPTYLYFLLNLLIIALGAEAGLLSLVSQPEEEKKDSEYLDTVSEEPSQMTSEPVNSSERLQTTPCSSTVTTISYSPKLVQESSAEKMNAIESLKHKIIKKCHSSPALIFIEGGETDQQPEAFFQDSADGGDDDDDEQSGQELFLKAETFIENFYQQLKMQREDSWNKFPEIYQAAF